MFLAKRNHIYYLYFNCPKTGQRKKISTKCRLKKDALTFLANFNISKHDKPLKVNLPKITVKEFSDKMLVYASENFSPKTVEIYSRSFNKFISLIGNHIIDNLNINEVELFKSKRIAQGHSKYSINKELECLKASFNYGIKWKLFSNNPCIGVKMFATPEKEKLAFTQNEQELILNSIKDDKFSLLVLFALHTGCRLKEIINIQWGDIDFKNKTIMIRNKPDFKTKTGKMRCIPITNRLYVELLKHSNNHENAEYIFANKYNRKYEYGFISKLFKRQIRSISLPEKYHFHCLRHTFITNLIKKGVSIYLVKELAGHSDIKTTIGYTHIVTDDLREAVNVL